MLAGAECWPCFLLYNLGVIGFRRTKIAAYLGRAYGSAGWLVRRGGSLSEHGAHQELRASLVGKRLLSSLLADRWRSLDKRAKKQLFSALYDNRCPKPFARSL